MNCLYLEVEASDKSSEGFSKILKTVFPDFSQIRLKPIGIFFSELRLKPIVSALLTSHLKTEAI